MMTRTVAWIFRMISAVPLLPTEMSGPMVGFAALRGRRTTTQMVYPPCRSGCVNALDNDETDPEVVAICNDGLDNDEDGAFDWPEDLAAPRSAMSVSKQLRSLRCLSTTPRQSIALRSMRSYMRAWR